jgi:hypothetical protein
MGDVPVSLIDPNHQEVYTLKSPCFQEHTLYAET